MEATFERQVLAKLPLAEAVLTLLRWCLAAPDLQQVYDQGRGRGHTRILSFVAFVDLMWDCLTGTSESARAGLLKAADDDRLPVSTSAFYQKLGRMPIPVSLGLMRHASRQLLQVLPIPQSVEDEPTESRKRLQNYDVLYLDGKVIKHVPRRKKALRRSQQNAYRLLGGRVLAACQRGTGLIVDMVADPDGEANEVKHVPALLAQLQATRNVPTLIVGDRAFGLFEVARQHKLTGHEFLLRKHGHTRFVADPEHPVQEFRDRFGRPVSCQRGWILRGKPRKNRPQERLEVCQLRVTRDKESLVLITSLLDVDAALADELLEAYLDRWDVECVFQVVTEVFRLRELITSSPEGMLFQLALCFTIYNVTQIVKQYVAQEAPCEPREISTEMLFRDVTEELIATSRILHPEQVEELIPEAHDPDHVRQRLSELLFGRWQKRWKKANYRRRNPTKHRKPAPRKAHQKKGHDSVYRVLNRNRK